MKNSALPRSIRKFIRLEKARIRAQFFDVAKQEEMIKELYGKFSARPELENREKEETKKNVTATKNQKSENKNASKKSIDKKEKIKAKKHEKKHNKA